MTPKRPSKRIKPQDIPIADEQLTSVAKSGAEKPVKADEKPPLPLKPPVKGGKAYKKKQVRETNDPVDPSGKEIIIEARIPDFFDHEDAGGKDKLAHDVEILVMEWAFFYPNHSPTSYILDVKSYSESQRDNIFRIMPAVDWPKRRGMAQDKLTGELVKRHVDTMAKVQDEHISASKLGLARAVQMLADGKTELVKKDGKPILDAHGNPKFKQFRSVDLLNCMGAIEKAQNIYRRALGLPNDEGGLHQILNKLEKLKEPSVNFNLTQNVQHNHGVQAADTPDLGYDDIMILIEMKREQKAKAAQTEMDERLRIEPKEGVPTGDFTATIQKVEK